MTGKLPRLRPDDDAANADWPKRTWDFPGMTDEDVAQLFVGQQGETFRQLQVMRWNPDKAAQVLAALEKLNRGD